MPSRGLSAGILLYRRRSGTLEVFLVHPGGPYWARRDDGAWQIPKGLVQAGEDPLQAARREFAEEVGSAVEREAAPLGRIRQAGGKWVEAFAIAGDVNPDLVTSNRVELEWPPHSGVRQTFPEIDRAGWFALTDARRKMLSSQVQLLDRLEQLAAD
jgi:predicted NUDIX family NTP pyrophosphohydrolase